MNTGTPPPHRLFVAPDTPVTCPKCEHEFSLEQGFARRALEGLEQESDAALAGLRDAERQAEQRRIDAVLAASKKDYETQLAQLKKLQAEQAARSESLLRETVEAERRRQATQAEQARQDLEKRLQEQNEQLQALRAQELELRRDKQQIADRAAGLEVETARKLDAERAAIEARVRQQEQERAALEKADLQKKLDDAGEQLAAAQRKMEQGSQQLQGEVLELAVEDALRRAFPIDAFEEVKKGARGGDIIHRVMTRTGQTAGTILWEIKRAKDWSAPWTAKLKDDMRACGADLGVIVTMACPKEFPPAQPFGLHEDVWVTIWGCALPLAQALRTGVLDVHKQRVVSAGKGESMEAVYDYVTSVQFAQKIKAVADSFRRMREELETEKTTTLQRWARREKQIQLAMSELIGIAGNVQGLAKQELPELELQAPETDPANTEG
jgi:hypothetical protein